MRGSNLEDWHSKHPTGSSLLLTVCPTKRKDSVIVRDAEATRWKASGPCIMVWRAPASTEDQGVYDIKDGDWTVH